MCFCKRNLTNTYKLKEAVYLRQTAPFLQYIARRSSNALEVKD